MNKRLLSCLISLAIGLGAAPASAKKSKKSSLAGRSPAVPALAGAIGIAGSKPAAEEAEAKETSLPKRTAKGSAAREPAPAEQAAEKTAVAAPSPPAPVELPPANPGQAAAAELLEAFGPAAAAILSRYGYVLLHEEKDEKPSLLFVSQSLDGLTRLSPAALGLIETLKRFEAGEPAAPPGETLKFLEVLELPNQGLLTPGLRSLARLLQSRHQSWSALSFHREPAKQPEPSLFTTRWGMDFSARTHADIIADPIALASPYFHEYLASIKPLDEAVSHFIGFVRSHYEKDLTEMLATDAKVNNASAELRAWIRRYLTDQRRLVEISRAREAVASLTKDKQFQADLKELEDTALILSFNPKHPDKLRKSLAKGAPPALVQLTSIGLHLKKPTSLRRYEMGDTVSLSGGYWVDGLGPKEKVGVQETTFVDYGDSGIEQLAVRKVTRRGGGPYTITREIPLKDSRSFRFHSIISLVGGNPLAEDVQVEVSAEFEKFLSLLAASEQQILDCNPAAAGDSLSQLERVLEPFASDKRQYKDLLKQARSRGDKADELVEKVAKLEERIEASREDSSPEVCRYDVGRTVSAIKAVNALPPGCDRYLPELKRQHEIILRRKSDQAAFSRAVKKARWKKYFCDYTTAAERLSYGLAILDADPAARCGKTAEAAKKAERDLDNVGTYSRWKEHLKTQLEKAEQAAGVIGAEGSDPDESLRLLNDMIARVPSLPAASCLKKELKHARALAVANGKGMVISAAAAAEFLPRDEDLSDTAATLLSERRKIEDAETLLKMRAESEQLPSNLQKSSAPPPTPAGRLKCLEEGMAANSATIDCEGAPFEVSELMDLRQRARKTEGK